MTRRRRGIVTWIWDRSLGHFISRPGRHTRAVARRGGSLWEFSPWMAGGDWVRGKRKGRKVRVRRRS